MHMRARGCTLHSSMSAGSTVKRLPAPGQLHIHWDRTVAGATLLLLTAWSPWHGQAADGKRLRGKGCHARVRRRTLYSFMSAGSTVKGEQVSATIAIATVVHTRFCRSCTFRLFSSVTSTSCARCTQALSAHVNPSAQNLKFQLP